MKALIAPSKLLKVFTIVVKQSCYFNIVQKLIICVAFRKITSFRPKSILTLQNETTDSLSREKFEPASSGFFAAAQIFHGSEVSSEGELKQCTSWINFLQSPLARQLNW